MLKETLMFDNNPRNRLLEIQVEKLDVWFDREMSALELDYANGAITTEEFAKSRRDIQRMYNEDYADIFSG